MVKKKTGGKKRENNANATFGGEELPNMSDSKQEGTLGQDSYQHRASSRLSMETRG